MEGCCGETDERCGDHYLGPTPASISLNPSMVMYYISSVLNRGMKRSIHCGSDGDLEIRAKLHAGKQPSGDITTSKRVFADLVGIEEVYEKGASVVALVKSVSSMR